MDLQGAQRSGEHQCCWCHGPATGSAQQGSVCLSLRIGLTEKKQKVKFGSNTKTTTTWTERTSLGTEVVYVCYGCQQDILAKERLAVDKRAKTDRTTLIALSITIVILPFLPFTLRRVRTDHEAALAKLADSGGQRSVVAGRVFLKCVRPIYHDKLRMGPLSALAEQFIVLEGTTWTQVSDSTSAQAVPAAWGTCGLCGTRNEPIPASGRTCSGCGARMKVMQCSRCGKSTCLSTKDPPGTRSSYRCVGCQQPMTTSAV